MANEIAICLLGGPCGVYESQPKRNSHRGTRTSTSSCWSFIVRALYDFCRILSKYEVSDEDMRSRTDNLFGSGNSLLAMSSSWSAAKYKSATPALELMKVFSYTSVACRSSC